MQMTQIEKRALRVIEEKYYILAVIFASLVRCGIAWKARGFVSGDMERYLVPWFNEIQDRGGLSALSEQVGNYGFLYQFLISLMTYIPLKAIYQYKILSIGFDFLLAAASGTLIWQIKTGCEKKERFKDACIVYCLILLSPIVMLNSSVWGQCDSIYTCFVVFSLIFLIKEEYPLSFIMLGFAFAFKLQTIFIVPFYIIWYIKTKRFSILLFLLIPLVMIATGIPGLISGRSVKDVFLVYAEQADTSHWISVNCGVAGALVANDDRYYSIIAPLLIGMTFLFLAVLGYQGLQKEKKINGTTLLEIAFMSAYCCFLFLPAMHERYGYLAEILGIILAMNNKRTIPLIVGMHCITLLTYGHYLFGFDILNYSYLGIGNVLIFILYYQKLFYNMIGVRT